MSPRRFFAVAQNYNSAASERVLSFTPACVALPLSRACAHTGDDHEDVPRSCHRHEARRRRALCHRVLVGRAPAPSNAPNEARKPGSVSTQTCDGAGPPPMRNRRRAGLTQSGRQSWGPAKKEGKVTIYGPFIEDNAGTPLHRGLPEKIPRNRSRSGVRDRNLSPLKRIRTEVRRGQGSGGYLARRHGSVLAMRDAGILEKWQAPSVVRERNMYSWLRQMRTSKAI